jgi:hypothetical protein
MKIYMYAVCIFILPQVVGNLPTNAPDQAGAAISLLAEIKKMASIFKQQDVDYIW